MIWLKKHIGLGLMALGTALLVALHLLRLTFVNALLFLPLVLVVLGLVLHVHAMKREGASF
ncbi:MAG: hypothetical protein IJ570_01695 [Prevotella sp.]|nr:hypothetical protein [Prevotella sp.]